MRLILILLLASLHQQAFGKTIFEPSVSLGRGSGNVNVTGVTAASGEGSGTVAAFGFRYGITRRYIHVAGILEGQVFAGEDTDPEFLGFGGFGIGYEWNIPLRTYLIAGAYDFDTDLIGTGVELAYFVSESFWVGIRYINFTYALSQEVTIGTATSTVEAELDLNTVSLIVSFPFEFNYPDHWFRKTDW